MAFPVVESVTTFASVASTTSHLVPMPATVNAGELLIQTGGVDGSPTPMATPSGWVIRYNVPETTTCRGFCYYRIADGSEGGTTVDFTTTGAETYATHVYRISNWHGITPPEVGTATTGSNTAPNPPSLTPSWGAADTLWIAAFGADSSGAASGYPANYTNGTTTSTTAGAGECRVGSARRELNATSDDPTAFTIPTEQWVANLIAIRPAAGGATSLIIPRRSMAGLIGR